MKIHILKYLIVYMFMFWSGFLVCVYFFVVFLFPQEAWQCFIFHPKCPFHSEGVAYPPQPLFNSLGKRQQQQEGLCLLRALGWKVYFCCHHPPCVHFFPWGSWGQPKAGFLFSVPEYMGMAAAQGCFTSLDKQRGEKRNFSWIVIASHLLTPYLLERERVREVQNPDTVHSSSGLKGGSFPSRPEGVGITQKPWKSLIFHI